MKTKTTLLTLTMTLLATQAFAEEPKLEITSFIGAGLRTRAAELCGKVTNLTAPAVVSIVVDPKSKNPGQYRASVGVDGKFCHVVVTNTGKAEAALADIGGKELRSDVLEVQMTR